LFRKLIADCAPDHFVPSDRPLLVSYVQATLLARRAAKSMTTDASFAAAFEKAVKIQAMLATRLRLAPQSTRRSEDRCAAAIRTPTLSLRLDGFER
jgi:hypothetical protein